MLAGSSFWIMLVFGFASAKVLIMGKPFFRFFSKPAENHAFENATAKAEAGDAEAQFGLGLKFANDGAAQDYPQAAHWYLKAADQNHALAQFNLGIMYSRGQGVLRDETLSMKWLGKAAHQGDAGAQYNLGMRHHRISLGEMPEKASESRIEAYKWLRLAAAQGYHGSESAWCSLALTMTFEGVADGSRRVSAFVAGQPES